LIDPRKASAAFPVADSAPMGMYNSAELGLAEFEFFSERFDFVEVHGYRTNDIVLAI
jgi:hypothetical protein